MYLRKKNKVRKPPDVSERSDSSTKITIDILVSLVQNTLSSSVIMAFRLLAGSGSLAKQKQLRLTPILHDSFSNHFSPLSPILFCLCFSPMFFSLFFFTENLCCIVFPVKNQQVPWFTK